MINRELIRLKVVQLVYAYKKNPHNTGWDKKEGKPLTLSTAEVNINAHKVLDRSLSQGYSLYMYLLQSLAQVHTLASSYPEAAAAKMDAQRRTSINKTVLALANNRLLEQFNMLPIPSPMAMMDIFTLPQDSTLSLLPLEGSRENAAQILLASVYQSEPIKAFLQLTKLAYKEERELLAALFETSLTQTKTLLKCWGIKPQLLKNEEAKEALKKVASALRKLERLTPETAYTDLSTPYALETTIPQEIWANILYFRAIHILGGLYSIVKDSNMAYQYVYNNTCGTMDPREALRHIGQNRVLQILAANASLIAYRKNLGEPWPDEDNFIFAMLTRFVACGNIIRDCVGDGSTPISFADDKRMARKLYKICFAHNEMLTERLEEHKLYWNDDKDIVDTFVDKTLKLMPETADENWELIPMYSHEEDKDFAVALFDQARKQGERELQWISEASTSWALERIAIMDLAILQTAIAELLTFPQIPVTVTINEYINIAKVYSTPDSARFINGVLANITKRLRDEHIILK